MSTFQPGKIEIVEPVTATERLDHRPRLEGVREIRVVGTPSVAIGTIRRARVLNAAWQRVLAGNHHDEFRMYGARWIFWA